MARATRRTPNATATQCSLVPLARWSTVLASLTARGTALATVFAKLAGAHAATAGACSRAAPSLWRPAQTRFARRTAPNTARVWMAPASAKLAGLGQTVRIHNAKTIAA